MSHDVSVESDGTVTIILAGELDIHTVPALEAALAPTLTGNTERVVVDAGALEFADSSAIAMFVRWANHAGHIEIRDPQAHLRRRLVEMGLADRLQIGPDSELVPPGPA